ncbi:MAG: DUF342 domain-containing protein [Lachnospiraceae bacterium]
MAAKNAYVRLKVKTDGLYLEFIPPSEGGMNILQSDVEAYLDKVLGNKYEKLILRSELAGVGSTAKEILLVKGEVTPVNETVVVQIAQDRLFAKGHFYPPTDGGERLTKEDIIAEMVKSGIKYGVSEKNIGKFLETRDYAQSYVLAEATKQEEGHDAVIKYFFNTDLTQKPRVNEDGSVDFHHLDIISSVCAGDLLAELTPAVNGKPGIDVCGGLLRPVKVKQRILRHGKNIRLSEDGLKAYSEVNGHATLEGDQIFVSDMYEVPANVDTSTGDITYEGNVLVHGNVMAGYSIQARGDIVVEGVVEGATLIAGGQIVLKRGIQGMDRGLLKAEGNVISRFIESATVEAGGYVTADAIMHSNVTAKGDITVEGKKGFITGGRIRSGSLVSARTIGSNMGTTTILEVGIDPAVVEEYHALDKELVSNQEEMEKLMLTLTALARRLKMGEKLPPDKLVQFKLSNGEREKLLKRDEEIKERMAVLKETIDSYVGGAVRAHGTVYTGCKIIISNAVFYVKQDLSYCRFMKEQGEVKVGSYY